jgi:hypothetical protein
MGFVEQPSVDRTLVMTLSLFEGRPHHALDRAAMAAVASALLSDTPPWGIDETLTLLLRRLDGTVEEILLEQGAGQLCHPYEPSWPRSRRGAR